MLSTEAVGAAIAQRIRDELVCCNIYQRIMERPVRERVAFTRVMKQIHAYHDICFWGEASARIAEGFQEPPELDNIDSTVI